jgi:hypothetical protein
MSVRFLSELKKITQTLPPHSDVFYAGYWWLMRWLVRKPHNDQVWEWHQALAHYMRTSAVVPRSRLARISHEVMLMKMKEILQEAQIDFEVDKAIIEEQRLLEMKHAHRAFVQACIARLTEMGFAPGLHHWGDKLPFTTHSYHLIVSEETCDAKVETCDAYDTTDQDYMKDIEGRSSSLKWQHVVEPPSSDGAEGCSSSSMPQPQEKQTSKDKKGKTNKKDNKDNNDKKGKKEKKTNVVKSPDDSTHTALLAETTKRMLTQMDAEQSKKGKMSVGCNHLHMS